MNVPSALTSDKVAPGSVATCSRKKASKYAGRRDTEVTPWNEPSGAERRLLKSKNSCPVVRLRKGALMNQSVEVAALAAMKYSRSLTSSVIGGCGVRLVASGR